MSRSLSALLAGVFACAQTLVLFRPYWLSLDSAGAGPGGPTTLGRLLDGGIRYFRFEVTEVGRLELWLPQLVYLVVFALSAFAVLRAVSGVRAWRPTALSLMGASLLAAGIAELVSRALDGDRFADRLSIDVRIALRLGETWAAPAEFALALVWHPVLVWTLAWFFLRRVPAWFERAALPVPGFLATREAEVSADVSEPAPTHPGRRKRAEVVSAALIPVVLLAVAGGPVLSHTNVRRMTQNSVTFDPELWLPYQPPALLGQWEGLLYPALRLRPLSTENTGGWLATLAVCVVLLVVLAWRLHRVAGRPAGKRPVRLLMEGWYATVLAATVAALVESVLPEKLAPRAGSSPLAEAVRFGTVWGWATGAALVGAVLVLQHKGEQSEPAEPRVAEGAAARS